MGEENSTVNLDLNLGPLDRFEDDDGEIMLGGSYPDVALSMQDLFHTDAFQLRGYSHLRAQRWRSLRRHIPISPETQHLSLELTGGNELQTGEGSVTPEGRVNEAPKLCDNRTGYVEDECLVMKKENVKNNGDEGSFFDCNICLYLAKDPVVTCCGHLFCWPCLYRWLHHHSDAKECPVCKGEVTMKDVTPIYGRGNDKREVDIDSSLKIPVRPQARRIQGWRQTIHRPGISTSLEEMIQRLEETYHLGRHISPRDSDVNRESPEGSAAHHRISLFRGIRRDQTTIVPSNDSNDSMEMYRGEATDGNVVLVGSNHHRSYQARENRRSRSAWIRRPHPHRAGSLTPSFTDDLYINSNLMERNQEPDRDSVSSIAAVIHSEGQTIDNAIEIDSTVARSTLSSRRRTDASRVVSDVDSGDSRAPRQRRRLN